MTSLRARLVMAGLRARRSKRFYSDPDSMRQSLPEAQNPHKTVPPPKRTNGLSVRTEQVGGYGCHVFSPEDPTKRSDTFILHLHGGAFVSEPDNHHWDFVRDVVLSTGATIAFPMYPLAPRAGHKEIRDCAMAAYDRFLADHPGHRFVFGDSAGGALAVYLTETLQRRGDSLPTALVLLSPWLDMEVSDRRSEQIDPDDPELDIDGLRLAGEWYAAGDDPTAPEISPVYADYSRFPPLQIFTGTRDILNPDAHRALAAATRSGVDVEFHEYPGMFHNWTMQPIPEGDRARRQLYAFLARHQS
ncbi:hypothetical protein BFG51_10680 [Dietzia alimentaria]|nr:hypothetical protein BFG51_10680 [Dietzia alimentaria]